LKTDTKELYARICEVRNELCGMVSSIADLTRPTVLAKSMELDRLVVIYHRLVLRERAKIQAGRPAEIVTLDDQRT